MCSDNLPGAVNQQERLGPSIQNPQRPYAEHRTRLVKIWSDLHGDMQSQAEMPWPPLLKRRSGGNKSVGPYPSQP
jgi:hypothetical protein